MSHADLIARLEVASGPRLELDGMVWCAVNGYEYVQWDGAGCAYTDPNAPNWDRGIKHAQASVVRPYTASLDAAVALVERALPGAYGSVQFGTEPCQASVLKDQTTVLPSGHYKVSTECSARASAATPAIALLIATLKALQEKHNER